MDPERVRGYLQVACAGLGFDIGEIWWTQNESGTSTLASIEEKKDENGNGGGGGKKRFVQLYTSKSYADKRAQLVSPEKHESEVVGPNIELAEPCTASELEKHKLSPQLVDAISKSAQVVWANCQNQEGLIGRSDMRLQTAVGMPVAVDAEGNMCVVVMFSPENLESTDEAMEYLQFISRSATSSSIPCLLPVFDSNTMRPALMPHPHNDDMSSSVAHPPDPKLGKDITAHYCSVEDGGEASPDGSVAHSDHDVTGAPKDCFGIPMLPSFAELGGSSRDDNAANSPSPLCDPFDEASFGIWATIMHTPDEENNAPVDDNNAPVDDNNAPVDDSNAPDDDNNAPVEENPTQTMVKSGQAQYENGIPMIEPIVDKPMMPVHRRERIEEFCSAFLEMSLFDISDVWMPVKGEQYGTLGHVTSNVSTETNPALNDFALVSQYSQIKLWSGAVGRAFASGNPVWSANYDVIVDSARAPAFEKAKIKTALAVPIFSAGAVSPACVLCCYSLVRAEAVPAVLRFVQQALRLLWTGLDKVEPHESIGRDLWKDVAPADLGEMAADVEMQHAFMSKKRPHVSISSSPDKFSVPLAVPASVARGRSSSLSEQLHTIELVRPAPMPQAIPSQSALSYQMGNLDVSSNSESAALSSQPQALLSGQPETYSLIQNHLQDAIRSIGDAVPWSAHQHLATNIEGSKRAHVLASDPGTAPQSQSQSFLSPNEPIAQLGVQKPMPLQMPGRLANQFPPAQSNISNASNARPSQSSPPVTSMPANNMSEGSTPFHPGFTPSMAGIQLNGSGNAEAAGSLFQPGVAPPPFSVDSSMQSLQGQACQPTSVTSMIAKLCRIQGCDELAVARRPYCTKHSGNRLCEHAGCTKCAQGSTRFCIAHGGGRRCTYPGCDKGARDKFFCAAHGGGKRCTHVGCTKSAVGGSNLCTSHGGGRRCAAEGCDKSAQSSTKFCVKHGGGKKCAHAGCEKVARGRTQFCAAHGGGVRCKLDGCNRVAIGKLQLCRTHGGGSRVRGPSQMPPQPVVPQLPLSGVHHAV